MSTKLSIFIFQLLLLAACTSREKQAVQHLPQSKGLPYEVAMIVPQAVYEGELRDTLEAVLKGSTPILPQHEPMFRVDVVYAEGNLTPWRTFRNRLIVEIDRPLREPVMGVARDAVARPQIEVKVAAATPHELAVFIGLNRQRLTDLFVDSELEVEASRLRSKFSKVTADSLRALTSSRAALREYAICVPQGLKATKVGQDFLWTGTNLNDKDQNLVFYSYPWNGHPLSPEQFVGKRDSVLKANIPGAQPNQWMQTARAPQGEPLIAVRRRIINRQEVLEVHGLWELHNGALGGAFVSLERIDTVAHRVLVTEGFIYSPHSPKRNLMRQMEASLRTFEYK